MSRRVTNVALAALLLTAASACSVRAQSDTEERQVAAFSRLRVQNGIDVELRQAEQARLRIEVEGYDLEDVVTAVEDGELLLSREGGPWSSFLGSREITVYLDFVELTAISASGGSDIEGRAEIRLERLTVDAVGGSDVELDVRAQSLEFSLVGGSDLALRGSAPSLVVEAVGGSDVSARRLEAERVELTLAGGSDASVHASRSIEIDASGGSDVYVYGNPAERTQNNDRSSDVVWR